MFLFKTGDHTMLDKIRKLMALADHPATNPNEAAAAAAAAARLAVQHNIDLDAINKASNTEKTFHRHYTSINVPLRDEQGFHALVDAVAKMYGCVGRHLRMGVNLQPVFVGQPQNTSLSESWFGYIWDSCKRCNREHAREQNYGSHARREEARSAFRYGFCTTVAERLHSLLMATMAETHQSNHTGGTALVVGSWFEAEQREVAQWIRDDADARQARYAAANPNPVATKVRRSRPRYMKEVSSLALAERAGADAGSRLSLNKQVK